MKLSLLRFFFSFNCFNLITLNSSSSLSSPFSSFFSISHFFWTIAGDSIGKFTNCLWIAEADPYQHRRPPSPPPSTTNIRFFSFHLSSLILHILLSPRGYDTSGSVFPDLSYNFFICEENSQRYIDDFALDSC